MQTSDVTKLYAGDQRVSGLSALLLKGKPLRHSIKGLNGSSLVLVANAIIKQCQGIHLFILSDKEKAAYFYNDLENLSGEASFDYDNKNILFYPTSYKKPYQVEETENANVLLRSEVLNRLSQSRHAPIIVSYPEALCEKVITKKNLQSNTLKLKKGESVNHDFIMDLLIEYEFERVDFVVESGQFSVRGGLIDVFSFSNDFPYRIEFFGDEVESIRSFDPVNQLSKQQLDNISILPNIQHHKFSEFRESLLEFIPKPASIWIENMEYASDKINAEFVKAEQAFEAIALDTGHKKPQQLFVTASEFLREILDFNIIEIGNYPMLKNNKEIFFNTSPQPVFNKNFEMLFRNLVENTENGYQNIIVSDNQKQIERLDRIFTEINTNKEHISYTHLNCALNEGFIDNDLKLCCYTDHQLFERYHKYKLNEFSQNKEALTLKEIYDLKPGDYVTHTDHGIGRYGGLEKINNNGKEQEAIRLIYKEDDILYVSIHSLHRISKYSGKEGSLPSLSRLGSPAWQNLKNKAKQKVKDIAKDLIKLYAERKAAKGFAFNADTYLQNELEASFIYEDTPDQLKATNDVKKDMEADFPMDRLVCGDVGFGKTEIAVRAAFKAVADSKQVAILVPTTILALQHYKTFRERLKDFPCKTEYINRFKTTAQKTQILKDLKAGKIDILIGTHRLVSKDVGFKDLGLLIIDEEQKFGVAVKEKLKQIKVDVDTLTLTATPIPRTLQFSLMGARDLSIINTPPPNRYPVHTELHSFNEELIRDAILQEVSRGGQVFFVHNRVQSIMEVAGMIQRLLPDIKVAIGHGQMDGHKLEKVMLDFIDGEYDVLLATTIIENGLDIPNANTIIINEAQSYGLSDLHQLRGRVGRSNKKSFCYLIAPPLTVLTDEARKRLKAIEEFSEIGSGFNIAMRDLDIRGAGDILGGEQSGFISEIGFDIYHKILDEAITELKETEFHDLYHNEDDEIVFVKDCTIETDLELMIPDEYIKNITERLSLYKELDSLETDEELAAFNIRLIDRFGAVPKPTEELINTIRLRRMAKHIGFEKLILKQQKLIAYFVSNQDSPYFQSAEFTNFLQYLQLNPRSVRMKENKGKLSIVFDNVDSISKAVEKFSHFK
ncbi:MAG: transcription-repair coupling factor [Bacteroidetes bacterium]|nr:transcription-repair coupling factor [Bacteroidota bacterium]